MKKITKIASVAMVGALAFSLAACGDSGGGDGDGDTITLRFGHWLTTDTPQGAQFEEFAELVNERSEGRLEVEVFPNSQLGNQRDLLEGVAAGTIEMTKADDAYMSSYVPEYNLLSLPFLFEDYEHLGKVLDSDLVRGWDEMFLEKTGMRTLGWSFGGFRYFLTQEPVTNGDLGRQNLRVPESDVYVETVKALNGNATPMPWGEVYTGLETGVVEGLESAPSDLYFQKFYEQAKYLLPTNHIQASATIVINDAVWQTIPEDLQGIITDAAAESIENERAATEEANQDAVDAMLEDGAELTEIDDRQAYIDKVQDIWSDFASQVENGEQAIEEIQNLAG